MFSRQLLELLALPLDKPTAARKLFDLVAEDYALTWKVLRLANSFHYNRSNRSVDNLTRAIVLLGVGTIRNLASALVCFTSAEGQSATLRALMVRSMASAHVAAVIAPQSEISDRESAYLAGMLQNLGEVLVAHRSPVEHALVRQRIDEGLPRDAACIKELGFTYDQLARVVGRHGKLAPSVCALWDSDGPTTPLCRLARFVNEVTRVMSDDDPGRRQSGIALLAMRHGSTYGVRAGDIVDIWEGALADMRDTFDRMGISIGSLS